MSTFFELFYNLIISIGSLWEWLVTPNETISNLLGITVIPLALILSATLIIAGVIRALL